MATKNIIKLLEKGNVTKDLKVAYSFMLLSRGYSADEIKALDDYDFLIRKKSSKITGETNQMDVATPRNRKQRIMSGDSPLTYSEILKVLTTSTPFGSDFILCTFFVSTTIIYSFRRYSYN
jgi:hypothetical protein